MFENKRLLSLLLLIKVLKQQKGNTIHQLANRFEVSERTMYRYLDILRDTGIPIEKNANRYRLILNKQDHDLLPILDSQELRLVYSSLITIANSNGKLHSILEKLSKLINTDSITDFITNWNQSQIMSQLVSAIETKTRIVLKNYYSPHSQTRSDRLIEPIGFTSNLQFLVAYEIASETIKLFKPERIDIIEVTEHHFSIEKRHEWIKPDLFGMSGFPKCTVSLTLSPFAYHLLCEEFPFVDDLNDEINPNEWISIELPIQGFEGIGRFILGLPGEIQVNSPVDLIEYVKQRAKKSLIS